MYQTTELPARMLWHLALITRKTPTQPPWPEDHMNILARATLGAMADDPVALQGIIAWAQERFDHAMTDTKADMH
jgi:hypothetical protein